MAGSDFFVKVEPQESPPLAVLRAVPANDARIGSLPIRSRNAPLSEHKEAPWVGNELERMLAQPNIFAASKPSWMVNSAAPSPPPPVFHYRRPVDWRGDTQSGASEGVKIEIEQEDDTPMTKGAKRKGRGKVKAPHKWSPPEGFRTRSGRVVKRPPPEQLQAYKLSDKVQRETKEVRKMNKKAVRRDYELELKTEIKQRAIEEDLDHGPLPRRAPGMPRHHYDLYSRLAMREGRLERERIARSMLNSTDTGTASTTARALDVPCNTLHSLLQEKMLAANQSASDLVAVEEALRRASALGEKVSISALDIDRWTLSSPEYLRLVKKPVECVMQCKELHGYEGFAGDARSYAVDIQFRVPDEVPDSVISIPLFVLPRNASASLEAVKARAFKFIGAHEVTSEWMNHGLGRFHESESPIQFFDVFLAFLGYGRMKVNIPLRMLYGGSELGYDLERRIDFSATL
ncbi:hypothetical protein BDV96DRAFT_664025 [Lophiotrema nucula]|uniref:Uncharacterized protein n=1 Tax=Lophiotrema nucula TaxID=690887 RepID=A0A6A5Z3Y3_9PLEO|nr:hypothetical protein BDV96DRAFT_664025 [Lophiotrema nucula]